MLLTECPASNVSDAVVAGLVVVAVVRASASSHRIPLPHKVPVGLYLCDTLMCFDSHK